MKQKLELPADMLAVTGSAGNVLSVTKTTGKIDGF